jgi:DNA-binding IscR family transcriptional regulator
MIRRENVVRAVELAIRMNTHPCPHSKEREQSDCTPCLAETAVQTVEQRMKREEIPWSM